MKLKEDTKVVLGIVFLIILIVAIPVAISEMAKQNYKDRLNTSIIINNYISIPNTNMTCSDPILVDNYYYCDIDNIEALR